MQGQKLISTILDSNEMSTTLVDATLCSKYSVPAGTLSFVDENGVEQSLVVTDWALYIPPECQVTPEDIYYMDKLHDSVPFYGSVTPFAYSISATTIMAWLLFILLIIAQKRRPLFQKIAVCALGVTLTAVLAQSSNVLRRQYKQGYQNIHGLLVEVTRGLTFEILDVISTTLLWLAHVQVVLRLFQEPQYRVLILGVGALLVMLYVIFQCLTYFKEWADASELEDRFGAISILNYVIQYVIILVYVLAVVIYSLRKRRHAYRPRVMATAIISLLACVSPLVFTSMCISSYWFEGWATFVNRICSAAASVVVWGWLDAIERSEKDEQKTGVMGRKLQLGKDHTGHIQVDPNYDEDMIGSTRSDSSSQHSSRSRGDAGDSQGSNGYGGDYGADSNANGANGPGENAKVRKRMGSRLFSFAKGRSWVISRGSANSDSTHFGQPSQDPMQDMQAMEAIQSEAMQESFSMDYEPRSEHQSVQLSDPHSEPHSTQPSEGPSPSSTPAFPQIPLAERVHLRDKGLEQHIHPVKRSRKRAPSGISSNEPSNATTRNNTTTNFVPMSTLSTAPNDNDDDDLYDPPTHAPDASAGPSHANVSAPPPSHADERPPDFFPAVPGFEPGDYWDDKAPPPQFDPTNSQR
uniref:pH-response regulator protein palH/RIM21 n=1 Tax=Blastobotrys adeninivorans TaxID=409370 RepID=A0A060T0X9_BLAAD